MRKSIIVIVCGIVTLLVGYTGYRGYQVWKQNHWLALAKSFAAKDDIANELLSLQQVLRLNPQNVEACRRMANLSELAGLPMALDLRQRIVELQPQSLDDRLALVQTALAYQNFSIATNALAEASDADKKTVGYNNIAGFVATAIGRNAEAEKYFTEALRLDPGNPAPQINLAILQLKSTNPLDQAEARIRLQRININTTNPAVRSRVRREIVMDAMVNKNFATALAVSKEMVEATNASFSDQLLRLGVLKDTKSPDFKSTLAYYQHAALGNPLKIAGLSDWMLKNSKPTETLSWLRSLPLQIQTNSAMIHMMADCLLETGDWHTLQTALQNQNWDEFEYARHAYLARALREQALGAAADAEWSSALQYASDQKRSMDWQKRAKIRLYSWAVDWKWNNERDELLWTLVNEYPDLKWAPALLQPTLITTGRTRPLMQLLTIMSKREPADMTIKNNLALTAMLLGASEIKPFDMAREACQSDPKNPDFVSTYAFSLYLQKNYNDALKVIQQLTPQQLSSPAVSGYYGLILNATGNQNLAKSYLAIATKASLLPEERKLFESALNR